MIKEVPHIGLITKKSSVCKQVFKYFFDAQLIDVDAICQIIMDSREFTM